MKNPYEQGVQDALKKKQSNNPYPEFTAKWGLYNQGYNKTKYPHMFKPKGN